MARGLLVGISVMASGCPVDPATTKPGKPTVDVGDACRNVNNVRVTGTKPASTRLVAAVTDPTGATTEVGLTEVDDVTEIGAAVFVTVDGPYSLAFAAETAAGVRSDAVGPFAVTIDREAPPPPTCAPATPVELPDGTTATVDVDCTVEAGDVAAVEIDGTSSPFDGSGAVAVGVSTGTSEHAVVVVDACGNRSPPATVSTTGAADLTGPATLTVEGPAVAVAPLGAATAAVPFNGTTESAASVVVRACPGACVDEVATTVATADDQGVWAGDVTLAPGGWVLEFVALDAALNPSAPILHDILVRSTLTVPTQTVPVPEDTNATALALGGARAAGTRVLARVVGTSTPVLLDDGSAGGAAWSGSLDISGVVDVPVSPVELIFTLFADDGVAGGDVSDDSEPVVIRVDRTAPAAAVFDSIPTVMLLEPGATSQDFPFSGQGEAGATVVVGTADVAVVDADGNFGFNATLGVTDTFLTVTLRDAAGNLSPSTTTLFTVASGLRRPVLTTPANGDFPVFTRAATVTLTGSRQLDCGLGGPCGVEAVDAFTGNTVLVAGIAAQRTWTGDLPLAEGPNRFFLRAFDAASPRHVSALRGRSDGSAFVVVRDTTPPAPPVVRAPVGEQGSTTTFIVEKGEDDGLLIRVNGEPAEREKAARLDGQTEVTITEPLAPGANVFCFVTIDRAGNRSDDGAAEPVCIIVTSADAPTLTVTLPREGDVIAGNTLRVEAAVQGAADRFEVCIATACSPIAPDATTGVLRGDVPLAPLASGGTLFDIEVCAVRSAVRSCVPRRVVRWSDPFRLSAVESVPDALTPAVAVDSRGVVHVVWQDDNKAIVNNQARCVAPHIDVIDLAQRNGAGKLVVTTSTPGGFAVGQTIKVRGADGFDGTYTVGAVSAFSRTVTTTQTVAAGLAPVTGGNVSGVVAAAICAGPDVFYRRLEVTGWSDVVNLSDLGVDSVGVPLDGSSQAPTLAIDADDNVHVVWQEFGGVGGAALETGGGASQRPDLVHRVVSGLDGTIDLADLVTVDTGDQTHRDPRLSSQGDDVVLVWREQTDPTFGSGGNIRLSRFVDGAWTPTTLLATGSGFEPVVAVDAASTAWVVWSDNGDGDRDVVLCRVAAGGTCAANQRVVVSDRVDTGASTAPALALVDETLHLAWLDDGDGTATLRTDPAVVHRRYRVDGTGLAATAISTLSSAGDFIAAGPTVAAGNDGNVIIAWPSLALLGATFNVARTFGRDAATGTEFEPPALLVGAATGNPNANAIDVAAVRLAGRSVFVAWSSDNDVVNDPGFEVFVHALALP